MSKAAELAKAGETLTNQPSGRKNLVTNGAMQIAQRSASLTGLGANQSTCQTLDRWVFNSFSSAGRLTMSQTADGPSGFANCMKLDCTTADTSIAATENIILIQRIEGQDVQQIKKGTSDAEQITVSFYVKASAAFTFACELFDLDNTRQITKLFDTTTGWVKHSITFPADTTGAFDDDNVKSLSLNLWLVAGSTFSSGTLNSSAWASSTNANRVAGIDNFYSSTDNEFFLTGVQIEIGSQATNFEHRSVGDELALCSRYYTDIVRADNKTAHLIGYVQTTAVARFGYHVPMRAAPTIAETNFGILYAGGSEEAITSVDDISQDNQFVSFRANVSANLTSGQAVALFSAGTATLTFDAEL